MGLPGSPQKHTISTYNPINHTGTPAASDAAAARKNQAGCGHKFAHATAAQSNLSGSSCMPKAGAPGSELKASSRPDGLLHLPARVDHLSGTACIPAASTRPGSGGSIDSSSMSDHSKHTAHKAKLLTLRAAVDHLGEGCTVRHVDVVATLDAPPPSVSRGMATRLVRDRQIARQAQEHNMASCLYQPGAGYTRVLSGLAADKQQEGGSRD